MSKFMSTAYNFLTSQILKPFSEGITVVGSDIQKNEQIDPEVAKQIQHKIELGNKAISLQGTSKNVILVIGATGAGKSTLVNYITNPDKLHVTKYKDPSDDNPYGDGHIVIDLIKGGDHGIGSPKIGHKTDSETEVPNKWQDSKGTVYWDCPGFGDTKGPIQDIPNSYFINKIFESASNVKILLLIKWSDLEGRSDKMQKLTDHLGPLFRNVDVAELQKSISLVVTKASKSKTVNDVFFEIHKILNSDSYKDSNSSGKKILEAFLGQTDKVSLFYKAKHEGKLNEGKNEKLFGDKTHAKMKEMIKLSNFIEKPKVNLVVDDKSKLYVNNLAMSTNDTIEKKIENLNKFIVQSCKPAFTKGNDTESLAALSKLAQHLGKVSGYFKNVVAFNNGDVEEYLKLIKSELEKIGLKKAHGFIDDIMANYEYFKFFAEISPVTAKMLNVAKWKNSFSTSKEGFDQAITLIKGKLDTLMIEEHKKIESYAKSLIGDFEQIVDKDFIKQAVLRESFVKTLTEIGKKLASPEPNCIGLQT